MTTAPPQHTLTVDQFLIHHLFRSRPDTIHRPDPGHLIAGFELFGDAFPLGHLLRQPVKHFLRLLVNLGDMILQSPGQKHCGVDRIPMLF